MVLFKESVWIKKPGWKLEFVAHKDLSIQAWIVAVQAMARRFGLWNKVRLFLPGAAQV